MEVRAEVLEKSIRKTTFTSNIISIVIALVTTLSVGYGFYFNTKSTLDSHEKSIQNIESSVDKNTKQINEIQVYKGVSSSEMENLEKKVDKIDEKLDKLLLLQTQ
jgi:cell division protein FtsX